MKPKRLHVKHKNGNWSWMVLVALLCGLLLAGCGAGQDQNQNQCDRCQKQIDSRLDPKNNAYCSQYDQRDQEYNIVKNNC